MNSEGGIKSNGMWTTTGARPHRWPVYYNESKRVTWLVIKRVRVEGGMELRFQGWHLTTTTTTTATTATTKIQSNGSDGKKTVEAWGPALSLRWPIPTETNAIIGHFYSSIRLLLSFFHSFFPLSPSLPPPPSPASPRVSFIVFYFFSFDRDGPKAPRKTVGLVAVAGTRSDDYRQMQHTHRHTHTDTHTDTHRHN